jgi:hypothetical protein
MAATAADTTAATYSGGIESLRGGIVEWVAPCTCARYCNIFTVGAARQVGRLMACVVDPADGRRLRIQHARPESVGEIPLPRY